ncbi:MAG: ABC transporter permease [Candidatus Aminicenantaceae bacterium]
MNYFFIDEDIDRMYKSENKFMHVFGYFTFLAIFIAFLGLFGLSAFNIQQRTKEISIRKVLGASYFNIMTLLSNNLFKLLLIANIFAWPISFFVMHKWLRQFAYKKDTSLIIFIGSTFFAFVIAFFTLGILALKASKSDPVNHLKYE